MERFRKEFIVNNEPRTFEFNKLKNMSGTKFLLHQPMQIKSLLLFSLRETDEGDWKLLPGSLRWLYEIENELSNAIREKETDSQVL